MADEKLRGIVQRMIDNNESNEFINEVIAEYKKRNTAKTKTAVETDVIVEESPTKTWKTPEEIWKEQQEGKETPVIDAPIKEDVGTKTITQKTEPLTFEDLTYITGKDLPDVAVSPYTHTSSKDPDKVYMLGDLMDLKDDTFVKEFNEFGVNVKSTGLAMGNAVEVTIPGQDPMNINLKPIGNKAKFETANQIKKLLDYRNDLDENTKSTFTSLNPDDDYGNISQEKLDLFNSGDYQINRTRVGRSEMVGEMGTTAMEEPALYDVVKDGETVFNGTHDEIKKYMIDNPQSEGGYKNIKKAQYDRSIDLYNKANNNFLKSDKHKNYTKEIAAKGYYDDNLANDVFNSFNIDPTFSGSYKNNKESAEITKLINSGISNYFRVDDWNPREGKKKSDTKWGAKQIKKEKEKKIRKFDPEKLLRDIYQKNIQYKAEVLTGLNEDTFVERFLPNMEKAWNEVFEEPEYDKEGNKISEGLDKRIAKYKLDKLNEIKSNYIEEQMKESGIGDIVMSSIYAKDEELNTTRVNLEERSKFALEKKKKDESVLKTDIDNLFSEIKKWSETNNTDIKIEYKEVSNGPGYYIVESSDIEAQNRYQKELNAIASRANNLSKAYKNTQDNLMTQWNSWQSSMDEKNNTLDQLESAATKDYKWNKILGKDLGHSFENMLLDIPILFGSESALKRKNQNQDYDATYLPAMGTASENWNNGSFGFYAARTLMQQMAPVTTAIAGGFGANMLFGSIRGATIARNVVPAFYGITSAGSKLGEMETLIDQASQARLQLKELDILEGKLDPKDDMYNEKKKLYTEQRIALNQTIADGNITSAQKWGLSLTVGLIEKTVTRYLGTLPNAIKLTKDIRNPLSDVIKAGTKNGYQNAMRGLGRMSWRVSNEVAEEQIIYLGSTFAEGKFLNKDMKYDQFNDIFWSSIIVAGPMNGVGVAYSSTMQHYASRPMYSSYSSIMQELQANKDKYSFLDPKKKGYQNSVDQLREERLELMGKLTGLNSEMEVMALLNSSKTGDLMIIGNRINELNKQANIDPTLSPEAQDEIRKAYIAALDKADGKEFKSEYDSALKAKNKIINSIDFSNAVERLYGVEGKRIQDRLLKDNPSLKEDPKALIVAVHQEFKDKLVRNRVAITRKDSELLLGVEQMVYGMSFEEYKKKTGKKNRNRKKEDEILARVGDQLGITSRNTGIILNAEDAINAAEVLKDIKLQDLEVTEAATDEDLQVAILNAYDAQKKKALDLVRRGINPDTGEKTLKTDEQKTEAREKVEAEYDEAAEGMIYELRMGETNAAIIGSKYIVKYKRAAKGEIENGNLLAGTALSHEIAHGVDQLTFANVDELVSYAKNLHNYMSEQHREIHELAMMRMRFVGGDARYIPEIPMEDQTSLFWDEYTKSIQDILTRGRYNAERRQILNEGQI